MAWATRSGTRITVGEHLGTGGEGRVTAWRDGLCIKIYNPSPNRDRIRKLQALMAIGAGDLADCSAWPTDVVIEQPGGDIVGFVMRQVSGQLLHQVFNAAERRVDHPTIGYRLLVHIARNVAAAIADVHRRDIVIGDLNSSGILVDTNNGKVSLIDIDSVQVALRGERFTCDVGKGEYLPPELHGVKLRGRWREQSSDHFSLAILIFQILCMGRHPFIGTPLGRGEVPDPDHAIPTTGYAYGIHRRRFGWDRVHGWPHPEMLAPSLALLFEAAFAPRGSPTVRPSASQWVTALDAYASRLVTCTFNPLHAHPNDVSCPWCDCNAKGKEFFSSPTIWNESGPTPTERDDIERQIDAIRIPVARRIDHIRRHAKASLQPWSIISLASTMQIVCIVAFIVMGLSGCVFMESKKAAVAGTITLCALIIGVASWGTRQIIQLWVADRLAHYRAQARALIFLPDVTGFISEWDASINELLSIPSRRQATFTTLAERHRTDALRRHLSRCLLRGERIRDIGPARLATLRAHGITSAADIDYNRVRYIKGFGPNLADVLLAWRDQRAATFIYQADAATISAAALQEANQRTTELLGVLRRLATSLSMGTDAAMEQRVACGFSIQRLEIIEQHLRK